jgi:phage terminase small subunit
LFAQAIHAGLDQGAAAQKAGYAGSQAHASRLMRDKVVQAELARLRTVSEAEAVATRDEILKVLTKHLRASVADFVTVAGGVDLAAAKEAGKLDALQGVQVSEHNGENGISTNVRVELHSVQGAADRLARMLGYNAPEKVEHKVELRRVEEMTLEELEAEAKRFGIPLPRRTSKKS